MSDPIDRTAIARRVAELVLATPGVIRLEPSIRSALVGLRSAGPDWRGLPAGVSSGADGVIVTSVGSGVEITVDLGTTFDQPAVPVAVAARQRVLDQLAAEGVPVVRVDLSILSIGDE